MFLSENPNDPKGGITFRENAAHHTVLLAEGGKGKSRLVPFYAQGLHELVGTECGIGAAIEKGVGYGRSI